MDDIKQNILNTIDDLITDFFYYDRKGDDELGIWDIEKAIWDGEISKQEIIDQFITCLNKRI